MTVVDPAESAAREAARRAGVVVRSVADMADLREVAELFASVWGRNDEGVPIGSEVMRSLVHAGGCVTAAFDDARAIVGAGVQTPQREPATTYSLIAGVATGGADRGIGYAVKLEQRAWALAHGLTSMVWTFDPLVSRNARFNLSKLGAVAAEYEHSFYGRMSDHLNGADESDRLVADWSLGSARAVRAAATGTGATADAKQGHPVPEGPADDAETLATGPDGSPGVVRDRAGRWVRVPTDIVELRRTDPAAAARWRTAAREAFTGAFAEGLVATHLSRDGWYLLEPGGHG